MCCAGWFFQCLTQVHGCSIYCIVIAAYISCSEEDSCITGAAAKTSTYKMDGFHLGLDVGTTSVKVSLVDAQTRSCIRTFRTETKATVYDTEPDYAEQDVQAIITALETAIKKVQPELLAKVSHVSICGQMHGCVFWNSKSTSCWLCPTEVSHSENLKVQNTSHLITWQDGRCSPEFLSSLPRRSKSPSVSSGFGCATIFWLAKHLPGFLREYNCAGTIMDFVVCMLCGLQKPVMSTHNAVGWGYFDMKSANWEFDVLESGSFPSSFLPDVKPPVAIAGQVQRTIWGIPAGASVGVALGDLQCSVLAALSDNTDAVLNIGTSCQLTFAVQQPIECIPNTVQLLPFFNGRRVGTAAALTGGNAFAAFVSMLQSWLLDLELPCIPSEEDIYNKVLNCAKERTATTVKISPTLWGERHAPNQRGQVNFVSPKNCSLGDVTASLCRGIVENLHRMIPRAFLISCGVERIVGTGTALERNQVLQKLVEQVFGLPLVMSNGGDAAHGAALAISLSSDLHKS